jgi:siroheme synthase (precorrin-2 oxidase/ferrochelatase)
MGIEDAELDQIGLMSAARKLVKRRDTVTVATATIREAAGLALAVTLAAIDRVFDKSALKLKAVAVFVAADDH